MHHSVSIVAAGIAASLSSAAAPAVPAGQPLALPAFHELSVAGPFDVTVTTGHAQRVIVTGDPRLLAVSQATVRDGRLEIRPSVSINERRFGRARVTIEVPRLDEASSAGSGPISIDQIDNDFSGSLAGSGLMRIGRINAARARFNSAGSGAVEVAGAVNHLELASAGSGAIRAGQLASRTLAVSVAGSGNITARASGSAQVSMVGGGFVRVLGGARCSVSRIGGGRVDCGAN